MRCSLADVRNAPADNRCSGLPTVTRRRVVTVKPSGCPGQSNFKSRLDEHPVTFVDASVGRVNVARRPLLAQSDSKLRPGRDSVNAHKNESLPPGHELAELEWAASRPIRPEGRAGRSGSRSSFARLKSHWFFIAKSAPSGCRPDPPSLARARPDGQLLITACLTRTRHVRGGSLGGQGCVGRVGFLERWAWRKTGRDRAGPESGNQHSLTVTRWSDGGTGSGRAQGGEGRTLRVSFRHGPVAAHSGRDSIPAARERALGRQAGAATRPQVGS